MIIMIIVGILVLLGLIYFVNRSFSKQSEEKKVEKDTELEM